MAISKEEFLKAVWITDTGAIHITGIDLKDTEIFVDTDVKKVILRNVETLAADDVLGDIHIDKVIGKIHSKERLKMDQLTNFKVFIKLANEWDDPIHPIKTNNFQVISNRYCDEIITETEKNEKS